MAALRLVVPTENRKGLKRLPKVPEFNAYTITLSIYLTYLKCNLKASIEEIKCSLYT